MRPARCTLIILTALLSMLASGCYNWRAGVTETASLQHSCPPEQIRVLGDNGDGYARVVQLDVCGQRRVYQDLGGARGFAWVDQTPVTVGAEAPRQPAAAAAREPASTSLPTASASDPFAVSVRRRIDERATAIFTCNGGPVAIEAQWDNARSATVEFRARGVTDSGVAECIGVALGEVFVPPGTRPGRIIHALAN